MSDKTKATRRAYFVGIILLLAAAILWSLGGALIKLINDQGRGPHAVTIAFYRSLFAGMLLVPLARRKFHTLCKAGNAARSQTVSAPASRSPFVFIRWLFSLRPAAISCVLFFALMTVCFVLANTKTEAANVIILQYTSTFWVFCLSPWLLRETPHGGDVWILGLAMIGIAVIFAGNVATDLSGLVISLGSGLFYGLLTMMIRQMRDSDSAAVTVLNNLGSALLLLPAAMLMGSLMVPERAWVLLVLLGVVQFGLPYYLFTVALTRVPAYQAALLTLAEPVLVPVWTYLAVREKVPVTTFVGGAVILAALALFVRSVQKGNAEALEGTAT